MTIQTLKSSYSTGDGLKDIQSDDLNVVAQFIKSWRGIGLRLRKGAQGFGSSLALVTDNTLINSAGISLTIKDGGIQRTHFASGAVTSAKTVGEDASEFEGWEDETGPDDLWHFENGLLIDRD